MKSPVQLYLRVRLADGTYPYLKPAYASDGHLRANYAMHKGMAIQFPGSTYYLRYQRGGRRVWETAWHEPSLALVALQRKVLSLQGTALGEPVAYSPSPTVPVSIATGVTPAGSTADQ
jgi:integrase/recombinase XerD